MKSIVIIPSFLLALVVAGCGGAAKSEQPTSTAATAQGKSDIVDTAVAAGSFKTLASALTAADLVATLKGPGPFTVFAPTDEAFSKLPAGTLAGLLEPENKAKLQAVLTYHVLSGNIGSEQIVTMTSAKTVQGGEIEIGKSADGVTVNGVKIVKTDIVCSNGVIHVIDAVLLPRS